MKETKNKTYFKEKWYITSENIPLGQSSTIRVLFTKCFKELTYILKSLPPSNNSWGTSWPAVFFHLRISDSN